MATRRAEPGRAEVVDTGTISLVVFGDKIRND